MKKIWLKIKRPVCAIIVFICLFLFLGCTGTAECGGDMTAYIIQGSILLSITILAGIIGGLFS